MNAAATDDPADDFSDEQRRGRRLRFELIFASLWLAFGLFALPALIFWVGTALLGPYGDAAGNNASLSAFYIDFYGDLADASARAWLLAVGPLLLISLLRAVFIGVRDPGVEVADEEERLPLRRAPVTTAKKPATKPSRVEPRMGAD